MGETTGWEKLICSCYYWCYEICKTNVEKVVIVEILVNEYEFFEFYDSMVHVGLFAWMTLTQ